VTFTSGGLIVATRIADCVVLAVPEHLADQNLSRLEETALRSAGGGGVRAVIFDLSALRFVDVTEFAGLLRVLRSTAVLGVRPLLVAVNPGIVLHVIQGDVDLQGIEAFLELDDAFRALGVIR